MAPRANDTKQTVAVFLIAVCLLTVAVRATARHFNHKGNMVKLNMHRVMQLQRRGPQPRAFEVTNVLELQPSEVVKPRQTVLHRCDELACCGFADRGSHHCVPKVEPVVLYFEASSVVMSTEVRLIKHEFKNHTSCKCVKSEDGI